jgi:hypothetical protein
MFNNLIKKLKNIFLLTICLISFFSSFYLLIVNSETFLSKKEENNNEDKLPEKGKSKNKYSLKKQIFNDFDVEKLNYSLILKSSKKVEINHDYFEFLFFKEIMKNIQDFEFNKFIFKYNAQKEENKIIEVEYKDNDQLFLNFNFILSKNKENQKWKINFKN